MQFSKPIIDIEISGIYIQKKCKNYSPKVALLCYILAKNSVFHIQMWLLCVYNEELRAISVRATVCHWYYASCVVLKRKSLQWGNFSPIHSLIACFLIIKNNNNFCKMKWEQIDKLFCTTAGEGMHSEVEMHTDVRYFNTWWQDYSSSIDQMKFRQWKNV